MALPEVAENLFRDVVFFVDDSVAAENRPSLTQDIIHRGATLCPAAPPLNDSAADNVNASTVHPRFDLDQITHIISETWEIPERQLIEEHPRREEIFTVTPQWHTRSRILYLQDPHHYSPDPRMIFSGIFVSCLSEMSPSDVDQIYSTVTAFGGGYRPGVTQDVTHIVTRRVERSHFDTIDTTKLGMMFVHPQWIIDCVTLQKRLPFQPYVFESPDILPPILRPEWHVDASEQKPQHMTNLLRQQAMINVEQENGWRSVAAADKMMKGHMPSSVGPTSNVFEGKKLILGCQIEVSPDFRVAIETAMVNAGGAVLPEEKLRECDIYITPWREGKEYLRAVKYGKTVATLAWLNHVTKVGRLTSPKDNLLHYPVPRGGVADLKECNISVTNYTGESRDYLKKLIGVMDAQFTTTLAREANTHLIAATKSGEKVNRAGVWNIPVLNHMYLEDCFIKWCRVPEAADSRYTEFPYGVNFMTMLGNAKLTDADLEKWTAPARDMDDDDDMQEVDGDITATGITPPTQMSEASQRDRTIRQAAVDDLPADMNVDHEELPAQSLSSPNAEEPQQHVEMLPDIAQESAPSRDGAEQDQPRTDGNATEMGPSSGRRIEPAVPSARDGPSNAESSPLSGGPSDGDLPEVGEAEPMHDEGPDDHMQGIENDVEKEATSASPEPEQEVEAEAGPSRSAKRQPVDDGFVRPTTKAKGKAPAKTVKNSRSTAASTTQATKRRRLSTPEKPDVHVASQPVVEGRARRQAATKAADMLHNVIAPDMALHDKEKKRKDIVSPKSRRAARVGVHEEGNSRKVKHGSATEQEETTDEDDVKPISKGTQRKGRKATTSTQGRSRSTAMLDTARSRGTRSISVLSGLPDEEEDREGDLNPADVKLMTTGFNLEEKLTKVLKSIGVRFTDKPLEMTHLICRAAMRTTKLLVGLAKGVDVLTVEWLERCAELKRMIDPSPFVLKDAVNERKLGFNLAESIARSKQLHDEQGGLFANKLFHITGRVKPDFDQIKDVVKAAGGDITRYISGKTRIPKEDQETLILISCMEDKDIWEDLLADEYNAIVYDKELLFTSILKMELDMDDHKLTI